MVFGFCVMCNAPQYTPKVCGSKTDPCPKCGWMYPLGDCSD